MDAGRRQILVVGGIAAAASAAMLALRIAMDRPIGGGIGNLALTIWLFHMLWEKRPWARPALIAVALAALGVVAWAAWHGAAVIAARPALAAALVAGAIGLILLLTWLLASWALRDHLRATLPFAAIARRRPTITLWRRGRAIVAEATDVGSIATRGSIRICDPDLADSALDLPVTLPAGTHPVVAYRWRHPTRGAIDVALVVAVRTPLLPTVHAIDAGHPVRPDLDGVIVDSGELLVRGDEPGSAPVVLDAGLGDGCYPVHVVKDAWLRPCAIVVDLLVWRERSYVLLMGQRLDEYGLVVRDPPAASPAP